MFFIELAKTEDALRPFVLACETKQIKLVTIAIGCIQKLISFHAIPEVHSTNIIEIGYWKLIFRTDICSNHLANSDGYQHSWSGDSIEDITDSLAIIKQLQKRAWRHIGRGTENIKQNCSGALTIMKGPFDMF